VLCLRADTFFTKTPPLLEQIELFFANLSRSLGFEAGVFGSIIGAILLFIVGFFIAKLIGGLVSRLVRATGIQSRVDRGGTGRSSVNIPRLVGKLVYYLLMVIVLIGVLEILGFESALRPLENLVGNFFDFLPRLIGAGVLAFAGYILATIAGELVALAVRGIEGLSERFGLSDQIDWANVAKQIVFVIVFVPILIAAVDVLGLDTISEPLTNILQQALAAIPKILAAGIILVVFYYLAKFVSNFIRNLLSSVNSDEFARRAHLTSFIGNASIPNIVSGVIFFFIVFSGVITAINILDFEQLSYLLNEMFEISVQILFGLVILAIGNVVANFAQRAVASSQGSTFLASLAKGVVLALFIAIALRTMGIADDIVNLAFGLTLGALAVAFALSFGLGGRSAAGKQMEDFLSKFRREASSGSSTGRIEGNTPPRV